MIGTDYYAASLVTEVAGTDGAVEFTLGRKCLELRSTYALTDQSPTGSTGSVTVSTDGAVKAVHALAVGTVVADDVIDISDAFRLKFDLTASATPAAITAVATPEPQMMQCLEIRGGTEAVEQALDLPGLQAFVYSRPHGGDARGLRDIENRRLQQPRLPPRVGSTIARRHEPVHVSLPDYISAAMKAASAPVQAMARTWFQNTQRSR